MVEHFDKLAASVKSKGSKKMLVVVAADDDHTLEGVNIAVSEGIVQACLIGNSVHIKTLINAKYPNLESSWIIDEKDCKEAARKGVSLIREGKGDFLMKGNMQTADLLRAVINKETGLQTGGVMSHLAVLEIPGYHKLLGISDGGMLLEPNVEQKAEIIKNAVGIFHNMGYTKPKVAVLSAAETVNPKFKESAEAAVLKGMNEKGDLEGCFVEGPISFDLMLSKKAAEIKGYKSPVAGDADIAIVSNITTGNVMAKSIILTGGGKMAGIIVGAKVPILVVSRGASAEEKYLSLVLAAATS